MEHVAIMKARALLQVFNYTIVTFLSAVYNIYGITIYIVVYYNGAFQIF